MEKCVDHPDNIAVEVCSRCQKYICGLHDSSLCKEHMSQSKFAGRPMIVILAFAGATIVFVFIGLINIFLINVTDPNSSNQGPDGISTIPQTTTMPDLGTVILIFFSVAIPMLSVIAVVLIRLSRAAKPSQITVSDGETDKDRSFFCQQCGSSVNWDEETCPSCGKNTDDERNLISKS